MSEVYQPEVLFEVTVLSKLRSRPTAWPPLLTLCFDASQEGSWGTTVFVGMMAWLGFVSFVRNKVSECPLGVDGLTATKTVGNDKP